MSEQIEQIATSLRHIIDVDEQAQAAVESLIENHLLDRGGRPLFGAHTYVIQGAPIICFDEPELAARIKTMATDGRNILINPTFLDRLLSDDGLTRQDLIDGKRSRGILAGLVHEAEHILHEDHSPERLPESTSRQERNIVFDMGINTRMQIDRPEIGFSENLEESLIGFRDGDVERFGYKSDSTILREWRKEVEAQRKQEEQRKKEQRQQGEPQQGKEIGEAQDQDKQQPSETDETGENNQANENRTSDEGQQPESDQSGKNDNPEEDPQPNNGEQPGGGDNPEGNQQPGNKQPKNEQQPEGKNPAEDSKQSNKEDASNSDKQSSNDGIDEPQHDSNTNSPSNNHKGGEGNQAQNDQKPGEGGEDADSGPKEKQGNQNPDGNSNAERSEAEEKHGHDNQQDDQKADEGSEPKEKQDANNQHGDQDPDRDGGAERSESEVSQGMGDHQTVDDGPMTPRELRKMLEEAGIDPDKLKTSDLPETQEQERDYNEQTRENLAEQVVSYAKEQNKSLNDPMSPIEMSDKLKERVNEKIKEARQLDEATAQDAQAVFSRPTAENGHETIATISGAGNKAGNESVLANVPPMAPPIIHWKLDEIGEGWERGRKREYRTGHDRRAGAQMLPDPDRNYRTYSEDVLYDDTSVIVEGSGANIASMDGIMVSAAAYMGGSMGVEHGRGALGPDSTRNGIGGHKPAIVVLVDTSRSMQGTEKKCAQAIYDLMRAARREKREIDILAFCADTNISHATEYTEKDMQLFSEKGMPMFGGGGTDFIAPIKSMAEADHLRGRDILGVVYLTDMGSTLPKETDVPRNVKRITFVDMLGAGSREEYNNKVSIVPVVNEKNEPATIRFKQDVDSMTFSRRLLGRRGPPRSGSGPRFKT